MKIKAVPEAHKADSVFMAGNFSDWNPGDSKYAFKKKDSTYYLDIPALKPDTYQFKFTRGSWGKTEFGSNGKDIQNRILQLTSDTTVEYSIENWGDDFAVAPRQHTATTNVKIIDTAFFMPQLNRTRRIWIYLPEGYAKAKKRYPVIYMQDGQNLFDESTSGYGEWGIDECLDSLNAKDKPAAIIIGVDNGSRRMTEYNPYAFREFGEGEGNAYTQFLAETLKPFIDKHYRTMPSKENTIIAGSSMGGLISYYAVLKYPAVFGKAGIFSPAFWTAPQINPLTDSLADKTTGQFFFYMGALEEDSAVNDMKVITEKLGQNSRSVIYTVIDPNGRHNEIAWRKWFPEFYLWIMGNGLSYQIKTDD